jgi:hypothetical protein
MKHPLLPLIPLREEISKFDRRFSGPRALLLAIALDAAVPLYTSSLLGLSTSVLLERARHCSETIAREGDDLLHRTTDEGATRRVFNALAEGLACLVTLVPGGVEFLGKKWVMQQGGESS